MKRKIKCCGFRDRESISHLHGQDVDFVGFILAPSKRQITTETLAELVKEVPSGMKKVGVMVNPDFSDVEDLLNTVPLDVIQLHGQETPEFCQRVKQNFSVEVIKVFHVGDEGASLIDPQYGSVIDYMLLDTYDPAVAGGTGKAFNWEQITSYQKWCNERQIELLVAGGITPENVEDLVSKYSIHGVDVASGVESNGKKDKEKIKTLVEKVKGMTARVPNEEGRFGVFGGKYVPETLMNALEELEQAYRSVQDDESFQQELDYHLQYFAGRETPLYFADRLTEHLGGAKIYLKREDLNHTGAHKLNNALGQGLLAKRMGKTKIVAETGAGQHGVASATVAAKLGLECKVFMGEEDIRRQQLNVFRMQLLGAEVVPATTGTKTLKDATNEAIRYWVSNVEDTFYLIGSVVGPHPYPMMVRDFQRIIGDETRKQILELEGRLPDTVVACVGGGSNAMGIFYPFVQDLDVRLIGVEAAGKGVETEHHAATFAKGRKGVIHGSLTYLLQDEYGQIQEPYSISAGLDYPGVGPEHAYMKDSGRASYHPITDQEALDALQLLCQTEGIIPALESSHAVAEAIKLAPTLPSDHLLVICLSGRGDKDVESIQRYIGGNQHE